MVINKKIKRTMFESKSQYLGSLFLIIISCLMYTMFNQLTSNMSKNMTDFEQDYVQEDANFIVDTKLENLEKLEAKFQMVIEETKVFDYSVSDNSLLRIFSENQKVNKPAVISGKSLNNNEILLDPAYGKANALETGDTLKVMNQEFKVAGYMSLPNYIYPIKQESDLFNDPKAFGIAVITKEDFEELQSGSSSYSIAFPEDKEAEKKIDDLKAYLTSQNIKILKWVNIDENPRVTYVTAKIDGISSISSSFPIFILLLTCILTGIVMWRLMKGEFIAIGTLYAIGYRKREILRHYLTYPLTIAIAGGLLGTILGYLLVKPMLDFMVTYFNIPINEVSINFKYLIISILLPVLFLSVCGYFIIRKGLNYSPLELMRGGREKKKVGFIEKKLKLDRLKFSSKFKIREQMRSIPRSIFLLFGVITATMLLLMGFAMKSSLDFIMKDTYEGTYHYEYQYIFNSVQQEPLKEGEGFSLSQFGFKEDDKKRFTIYGIAADSDYISLKDRNGREINVDTAVITKPLADKLKVKAGDTIDAVNKLDSREYSFKIGKIADTYVGDYIYMPIKELNEMLGVDPDSYMGVWSLDKLELRPEVLLSTSTLEDMKASFATITGPMQSYVSVIAFLAFIIGLVVIYVVTSLIIEENKENISLMKVLGYRKKEVYSLILNSSSITVIIGYLLGVPFLLTSISAIFMKVTDKMNFAFPVRIEYQYTLVGFIIIYLTYEASKFLSRKKVNRISMAEALKSRME